MMSDDLFLIITMWCGIAIGAAIMFVALAVRGELACPPASAVHRVAASVGGVDTAHAAE